MNIYDVFPSNYLRAADLNGRPYTLTMKKFVMEEMGQPVKQKPVVYFVEAKRGLVLNKTNAMVIAGLYGSETDAWAGKRITLYPTIVQAFGEQHEAIRVADSIPTPVHRLTDPAPEDEDGGDLVYTTDIERPQSTGTGNGEVSFDAIPGAREQSSNGTMPHWRGPMDAQIWAMENGTCANEHEARNSWKKVVVALGGFTPENAAQVYEQFYARQTEKLTEKTAA